MHASPSSSVRAALLQKLSNVGMATEPAASPHPPRAPHLCLHPTSQRSRPPQPCRAGSHELFQARSPGSHAIKKPHLCSCTEDLALPLHQPAPGRIRPGRSIGSLRPRRGPSGPRAACGKRMFSLSSPGGLDTLLFCHCFSKERLFITADPWGKSFSLSLSLMLL